MDRETGREEGTLYMKAGFSEIIQRKIFKDSSYLRKDFHPADMQGCQKIVPFASLYKLKEINIK